MPRVMDKVAAGGLVPLQRARCEDGLGIREWRPLYDYEGRWLQKVIVQLKDEAELRRLHRTVHGLRVAIAGHEAAVEVESLFLDLDDEGGGICTQDL